MRWVARARALGDSIDRGALPSEGVSSPGSASGGLEGRARCRRDGVVAPDGAEFGCFRFGSGGSERSALSCAYFSAWAGMMPVAKATAAAWVRFMQCNLWRPASRWVFTLPNAKPKISAIS